MTDRPTPRVARANPAPRRALPRVTPLGVGGTAPADPAAEAHAATEPEATGRDLLIPNGGGHRRKARGSATVPTLAELMPPSRPASHGKSDGSKGHGAKDKHGKDAHPKDAHPKDAHPKDRDEKDGKVKEIDLQITLSKGLRKRLKAKSAELGMTPEDAIAQLVEVWVDG